MQRSFEAVKEATDRIWTLNQDAMYTRATPQDNWPTGPRALAITAAGGHRLGYCSGGPHQPTAASAVGAEPGGRSAGEGGFRSARVVDGHDEIAGLAQHFNEMADHLDEYRNRSKWRRCSSI